MDIPLLQTKFHIPQIRRADFVPRPHLIEQLNTGLERKLILVSAPAGFGKTTLISHWLNESQLLNEEPNSRSIVNRAAWLSIDEGDNDLVRFLSYVFAALQQVQEGLGEASAVFLRSPQPPPLETILTSLLNALTDLTEPLLLVLDDYHLIESEPIHNAVTFLVEHLPPQIHLTMLSRSEPPLPLARLRVRAELLELTADDLRLTGEETAVLLNQVMGLNLEDADLDTLEARTEGWIAGLRLAALALQSRRLTDRPQDIERLVSAFAGDDRYVLDYLTAEVLAALPADIQRFLLQTSILKQLSGPLCQAVSGQADSQLILERLERENLFVIALDHKRAWYRYHRLFADFLQFRLQHTEADAIVELNDRASAWCEANGMIWEAIDYALAAQNYDRAASLIEQHFMTIFRRSEIAALLGWLQSIPTELIEARPVMALVYAGTMLFRSQFDLALPWIEKAEKALERWPDRLPPTLTHTAAKGYIETLQATIAVNHGHDPVRIVALSKQALANLPAEEHFLRGSVALNLGDAYNWLNELEAAEQACTQAIALTEQVENLTVHLAALGSLGSLYEQQGNLPQAAEIYRRAIQTGQAWGKAGGQTYPATGKAHAFLARVVYAWNDLAEAQYQAEEGVACCKRWGHATHLLDSYLQLVQVLWAKGDVDGAQETLATARLLVSDHVVRAEQQNYLHNRLTWMINQVDQLQLWLWLKLGNSEAVARWLAENQAALTRPEIAMLRLRLLLAQNELNEGLQWSQSLLDLPVANGPVLRHLQLLLLRAIIFQRQAQTEQAISSLTEALSLAEPGGYLRAFIDEGDPIARLLPLLQGRGVSTPYLNRLQAAVEAEPRRLDAPPLEIQAPTPLPPNTPTLIEPLSDRELDVLALIAEGLKYREIAERLIISLNTVRTHTKHIYGKLEVNNRQAAIAKARELKLLP